MVGSTLGCGTIVFDDGVSSFSFALGMMIFFPISYILVTCLSEGKAYCLVFQSNTIELESTLSWWEL